MSKEIYISTTPHETRLAIVEDEQLAEIYYERENEYTLAGSIYNGKVTRVLPGMQSSFVDIGLERDAFLYVTDFMEEQGDAADFESDSGSRRGGQPAQESDSTETRGSREAGDRGRGRRYDRGGRGETERTGSSATAETESTVSFDEPVAPVPTEATGIVDGTETSGSRRWRGRRGRRRGRGSREEQPGSAGAAPGTELPQDTEAELYENESDNEAGFVESLDAVSSGAIQIDLEEEPSTASGTPQRYSGEGRGRRDRGRRGDRDRGSRRPDRSAPAFDNSYAGYGSEADLPEATGGPVLLPGESIRKYREPAEVAAEEAEAKRNAPAPVPVLVVSAPSVEIVGWDGGSVLPGESLSRKRGGSRLARPVAQEEAAPPSPATSSAKEEVAPAAVEHEEPSDISGETSGATQPDASSEAETASSARAEAAPEITEAAAPAGQTDAETEYEPEEGASASVLDNSRRDLRRYEQAGEPASQTPEQQTGSENELAGEAPDSTTYDLHASADADQEQVPVADPIATLEVPEAEYTQLSSGGEMVSVTEEISVGTPADENLHPQDELSATQAIAHEAAIYDSSSEESAAPVPPLSEDALEDAGSREEIHAYGDGDLHEEEMDELDGDEYEYPMTLAVSEESEDEYEEETLDDSSDLVSVLHEMSQNGPADDEGTESKSLVGKELGFTVADFGGEPDEEDELPAAGTDPGTGEAQPQRDGYRRPSNGRDRRGGRSGGGDRGRGNRRQSMQTTDLPAINELLKPGQEILVQIAKEPIAKKGARITSHIALPGRFLVFMPTVNHTGVSRKISSDEERRRLKSILLSEKGDAQGGFIVRTAADGASEEELRNDLRFLIQMWTDIKMRSESSKSPALIYHDLNLVERILRDQVTDNFSAIWVDTEQEYERVLRFLQRFQPSLVRRVKLYTKETPLFEHFGVTAEIDKALKSKVWLKSGGSIVINQTEALVAIDINTGKYVGKTARLEDTILKTNLDAIPEIVRQIRLRDLGGIIVIDFIDMDERKNRAKVMQALEDAMRTDRAPSKILPFNDFGLVIMTRKRVKQSLERTLCMPDPVTEGTGMIKSPITIANEIYIEMRKMYRHLEKADVMLRVHPEVVKTLKANGGKRLQELEDMTRKTILVKSDPTLSPEAFDIH